MTQEEDAVNEQQQEDDEFDYEIKPLKPEFTVKTRYKFIGKGKPISFDFDDGE